MTAPSHSGYENEFSAWDALYALGLLGAADKEKFERHLSECRACRDAVENHAATIAQMALSSPSEPGQDSKDRFLLRLKSELPEQALARLKEVLITSELSRRKPQERNAEQFEFVLHRLAQQISGTQQQLLEQLVQAALDLCDAGTAGFSLLCDDENVFRWDALAGALRDAKGGTTPRNWSPCGTTLDLGSPQLFDHPSRCFEYFSAATPAITEGLVVPVYVEQKPFGTLWIASHDENRKFDREDARVMNCLAHFCSAAVSALRERQQPAELL